MAAHVNNYLFLNAFMSPELFGAWKLAPICPIKALLARVLLIMQLGEIIDRLTSFQEIGIAIFF